MALIKEMVVVMTDDGNAYSSASGDGNVNGGVNGCYRKGN